MPIASRLATTLNKPPIHPKLLIVSTRIAGPTTKRVIRLKGTVAKMNQKLHNDYFKMEITN